MSSGLTNFLWVAVGIFAVTQCMNDDQSRSVDHRPSGPTQETRTVSNPPRIETAPVMLLAPRPKLEVAYVTASSLRMRDGPGTNFQTIASFREGTAVKMTSEISGNWVRVVIEKTGASGWMHTSYLSSVVPTNDILNRHRDKAPANVGSVSRKTDDEIRRILIARSISGYFGSCPCPYNLDRGGRRCGGRSAYSRPGGASPRCYPSDITAAELSAWRERLDDR